MSEPPAYPESGEPEDYILEGTHDEEGAQSLHLWEPVPTVKCESQLGPSGLILISKTVPTDGFIGLERSNRVYFSPSTMLVIADYLNGWASFDPIEVTVIP